MAQKRFAETQSHYRASHILGPFGKDSALRQWGLRRVGGGSRVEKKKAKVAVACS